jgi:xanthine/uracil permease
VIHLELFYYFISFAMGFASLIFTLVFFRKNGEVLYKYLLFFLSTLTLVVLTKTILFYIVLNTRYDLLTLYFLQFASIMGHCALIYTIPKFLHSFERFSWRGVVDGFFGSLAGLLAAGYFLFWGDAIAEIIVNLAIGLIVIIIFYSLIVVIIRWAEGKKRGRRSFQTFLLANLILAIILLPGFNLFSNFFYERFPFLEDLVLRDFYTFPAFYFLFNLCEKN